MRPGRPSLVQNALSPSPVMTNASCVGLFDFVDDLVAITFSRWVMPQAADRSGDKNVSCAGYAGKRLVLVYEGRARMQRLSRIAAAQVTPARHGLCDYNRPNGRKGNVVGDHVRRAPDFSFLLAVRWG